MKSVEEMSVHFVCVSACQWANSTTDYNTVTVDTVKYPFLLMHSEGPYHYNTQAH